MSDYGISEPQLRRWANRAGITLSTVRFPRESVIFGQGDPSEAFYVVDRGWVQLTHVTEDGRSYLIRLVGSGDVLGKSAMLDGAARRAYAQTLDFTRLFKFDSTDVLALVARSDGALRSLLALLIQESFELQARLLAATWEILRKN